MERKEKSNDITVKMARHVGKIDTFNESVEDWPTYVERVELYFIANDIPDEKKSPVLLSLMGSKTYNLLRNLTAPDKPVTKSFSEIVKTLKDHLSPEPLLIAERFRFHKRFQSKQESIATFVAELKKLSERCQFGTNLDDSLRDRFVCGLTDATIQNRLLTQKTLNFAKAVEMAKAMESAAKESQEFRQTERETTSSADAHRVTKQERRDEKVAKSKPCYRCGGRNHDAEECYYKDKDCFNCDKKGHTKKMCRSTKKKERKSSRVKAIANSDESDTSEEAEEVWHVYSMRSGSTNPIVVDVQIEGVTTPMEVDTGAGVTLIPKQIFDKDLKSKVQVAKNQGCIENIPGRENSSSW